MHRLKTLLLAIFAAPFLFHPSASWAQIEENEETEEAPRQRRATTGAQGTADVAIEVVATRELVEFDVLDTGRTTFTESAISILMPGFGDPNLLFETLPNVQFDGNQDRLTNRTVQDLSPAQFSIAGGRVYDNQFVIDGIGINSVMDSVSDNPNNFNEVIGHSQTVYLEGSLLEQAAIFDSNIPAEFTGFTGGVVSYRVRNPKDRFGFSTGFSHTSSAWTQYVVDEANRTDPMPRRPEFEQQRFDSRADIPLSERVRALVAYTRSTASVRKPPDQSLFGDDIRGSNSTRENYLAKVVWDVSDATRLTAQTLWTPYRQEFLRFNTDIFRGGGTSSYIEVDHMFDSSELTAQIAYNTNDTSRTSDPAFFIFANTASTDWVPEGSRSAQKGGFGDLDSTQSDLAFNATQTFFFDTFTLRAGVQAAHIVARRARPETNFTFRNGVLLGTQQGAGFERIVTVADGFDPNDQSIIPGEQILTQRIDYLAHDARVSLNTFGLWTEYGREFFLFDRMEVRARWGARYDYDEFLGNHNFAPRLSTAFSLPFNSTLTLGLNRYYSRNMVVYKLREAYPDEFLYDRIPAITREISPETGLFTETLTYTGEWTLREQNRSPRFSQADLNTPYSDEISAALTFPFVIGQARVRVLRRQNRDEFVRSPGERDTFITENGVTRQFTQYFVTNNGFTDFESLALEWQGTWRGFIFDINSTFSKTVNGGANSFFSVVGDGDDQANEPIFYRGEVRTFGELTFLRDNFATPVVVNSNITRALFENRLVANLNLRYRAAFDSIEAKLVRNADNSAFIPVTETVGGLTVPVYEDVRNSAILRANVNLRWNIIETRYGSWQTELRVRNVTNSLPRTTATAANPYQRGRSFWLQVQYRF